MAMGGHIVAVKLLLDEGTDMNLHNQQEIDVADFARRYCQDEIAAGLESRRRKLAERSGKPVSAPVPAVAVSPPAKAAAPDVPTSIPFVKRNAGVPSPVGRGAIDTPTNMLSDNDR